jgi:hypothetical protein
MAKTGTTGSGARRVKPDVSREQMASLMTEIEAIAPRPRAGELRAEFVPKFVAALRARGFTREECVKFLAEKNIGVTVNEVHAAFKAAPKPGAAFR